MTEAYSTLLTAAKRTLGTWTRTEAHELARAVRRIESPILKLAIYRDEDGQGFPLVNIATVRHGELAGEVLRDVARNNATEIVTAWNTGNRRYAVSLLNATRDNQKRYAIRH